jgi:transcriptional regulator NrdR family protein
MPKATSKFTVTCPYCDHAASKVTKTLHDMKREGDRDVFTIRRRRECLNCKAGFMTKEISEEDIDMAISVRSQ